ncbi:MBL fold metallo-hydrolase [Mycoplasma seminis]|uniref:MBL fold metallo-hydrolase n=1 Tax=Mycoplasma seminis TaxID=512749 RepID=A0ABY9HA18_9MOLU|nr:MBL fold metallo-hydrolase [Mycoplasma seminis]WLP85266.1 MBL fold metallo-hydrolase [Mycoplasma seminis]
MDLLSLGSSSKGNAYLVKSEKDYIGLDIGISPFSKTPKINLLWRLMKYLFISHEHEDHTKYLTAFLKQNVEAKIFINRKCYELLKIKDTSGTIKAHFRRFIFLNERENKWENSDLEVTCFEVNHNSLANNGYVIKFKNSKEKVAFFTDCGSWRKTTEMEIFNNTHMMLMEVNHHIAQKRKVYRNNKTAIQFSDFGHFSHQQALELLKKLTKHIHEMGKIMLLHQSSTEYRNAERMDGAIKTQFPAFEIERVAPVGVHYYKSDKWIQARKKQLKQE